MEQPSPSPSTCWPAGDRKDDMDHAQPSPCLPLAGGALYFFFNLLAIDSPGRRIVGDGRHGPPLASWPWFAFAETTVRPRRSAAYFGKF